MSSTAVGHCPNCAAMINRHWQECLVCHTSIAHTTETGCTGLGGSPSTIQHGSLIAWTRAGQVQVGTVDFIYVDAEGATWAFTVGKDWSALNTKFVRLATNEDLTDQASTP